MGVLIDDLSLLDDPSLIDALMLLGQGFIWWNFTGKI